MITGGVILFGIAAGQGEMKQFSFAHVTALSFWSWLYLTIAGSLVAYFGLRVVAPCEHARTRGDLCLRESAHRSAARLHDRARSVLTRNLSGRRIDHRGGGVGLARWRGKTDRARHQPERSGSCLTTHLRTTSAIQSPPAHRRSPASGATRPSRARPFFFRASREDRPLVSRARSSSGNKPLRRFTSSSPITSSINSTGRCRECPWRYSACAILSAMASVRFCPSLPNCAADFR